MYTCEVCNYSWDNKENEENCKFTPFRCPKCRENTEKLRKQNRERSKREDRYIGGYFPPPWNPNEHPEKTDGWIAFQEEQRKDPGYYGCGALNSMET